MLGSLTAFLKKYFILQVSKQYRTSVSERTDADEQKRRNDKRTVTVIKYGDLANSPPAEPEPAPAIVPPPKVFLPFNCFEQILDL